MVLQLHQEDAEKHGLDKALILHHLRREVYKLQESGKNLHYGWNWYFITASKLALVLPFSQKKISRLLRDMEHDEIIKSKQLSFITSNRVKYYTIIQQLENYQPTYKSEKPSTRKTNINQKGEDIPFMQEIHKEQDRHKKILNKPNELKDWLKANKWPF